MDFDAKGAATRLTMMNITIVIKIVVVVIDAEQCHIAKDIRVISVVRVVHTVAVDIHKRSEGGGETVGDIAVARPGEDILRDVTARISDKGFYLSTRHLPHMVIIHHVEDICRSVGDTQRTRPEVFAHLVKTHCCQMEAVVGIETANPQCVLEDCRGIACAWHKITLFGILTSSHSEEGTGSVQCGSHIVDVDLGSRMPLSRHFKRCHERRNEKYKFFHTIYFYVGRGHALSLQVVIHFL